METWKQIPNTEGKYLLSNFNRVKSIRHFKLKGTAQGLLMSYLEKGKIAKMLLPKYEDIILV